jgi:hypothetical protein
MSPLSRDTPENSPGGAGSSNVPLPDDADIEKFLPPSGPTGTTRSLGPATPPGPGGPPGSPITLGATYDPGPDREQMRGVIAVILLTILAVIVVGAFLSLWTKWAAAADLETFLQLTFAPMIGLVGAVTGFYYGSATAVQASAGGAAGAGSSGGPSTQNPSGGPT